jgi:tetratricopeptide (TPR) repeat protein
MENTETPETSLSTFIALWDEDLGPVIEDQYPDPPVYENIDGMAINLFMTFQTIFGDAEDVSFKKMFLTIPFKSENCVARINLDVVPNEEVRAGLQPFIVVSLIPGELLEESIQTFDPILEKIADQFKATHKSSVKDYVEVLKNTLNLAQHVDDIEINLEAGYDLQAAISDFKLAIEFFQKKKLSTAYPILKQALMKFELEKQERLALEASYMLGTLLVQMKKFQAALNHFLHLSSMASAKHELKYQELFSYMLGLCYYKLGNYQKSYENLAKINILESKFVDKLKYFSLMARDKIKLEKFKEAIEDLEYVIQILTQLPESKGKDVQIAQMNYELGLALYSYVIQNTKDNTTKSVKELKQEFAPFLLRAINHFGQSAKIWEDLSNLPQSISTLELIGNIYRMVNQPKDELLILKKTVEKAKILKNTAIITKSNERIKELKEKIKIMDKNSTKLDTPTNLESATNLEAPTIINEISSKTPKVNTFINSEEVSEKKESESEEKLSSAEKEYLEIVNKHMSKGAEFLSANNLDKAAIEYINSLTILRRMKNRPKDEIMALEKLVFIYKEKDDADKVEYYEYEIKDRQ